MKLLGAGGSLEVELSPLRVRDGKSAFDCAATARTE